MLETKHHWLPIGLAVYFIISCFITYAISVHNQNVEAVWPYISDTGTIPPESCVFGQLLNIGAVLGGIIVYIRYRHVLSHFQTTPGRKAILRINTFALILGFLMMLGVSLVGNFQETNVLAVHLLGAFLAFFVGFVYCIVQTVLTFKISRVADIPGNGPCIRKLRVVLCIADFVMLLLLGITAPIAKNLGPGPGQSKRHWTEDDPAWFAVHCKRGTDDKGYAEHVAATVSEWLAAFMTVIYFATFYQEFKHFRVRPPQVDYYDPDVNKQTADVRTDIPVATITA